MAGAGKMASGLTAKQAAFAAEYLRNGRNATAAYRHAYDAGQMSDATVSRRAHELVRHGKIAARLTAADRAVEKRVEAVTERLAVTKETIAARLAAIAWGRAEDLGVDEVPLRLQEAALMDLAKLRGDIVEKRETRVVRSISDLSDDELAAIEAEAERSQEARH